MSFLEYAPAPESRAILSLRDDYGLFIDGEFVDGRGTPFQTISPASEEKIAMIANANEADVADAVAAARRAYDRTWSKMSGRDRGKYLFRIARLVQERSRELAVAESLDNGKPIKESRDVDVPLVAAWFFYYAGWADKLDHAGLGADPRSLGVAAQVIPWNFPLLMLAWKIAPALAAGNTVVLKPAETTPLSALIFAEILQQADLPPGVVNIITGAGDTGAALVSHEGVDKVAFTGSTAVGRAIAKQIAGTDKKVTLELGGKAANIVFDDAPIDQAIEGIVNGIFFNQGHVCCAGSRLLVQENIHDEVVERLKLRLSTLRLGDPLDKNTDIGAINSKEQLERIRELSDVGVAEGAERWSAPCVIPENGFWYAPTIFTNVQTSSRIAREEIFGPVLSVLTFRTPAEAIAKANNTPYGLSAGIWTDKGSRILAVADQLRAGVIWANTFNRFDPSSPFGGSRAPPPRTDGLTSAPRRPCDREADRDRGCRAQAQPPISRAPISLGRKEGSREVTRLAVPKTYKLYIGGAFPRSESGRTYEVMTADGRFIANAAKASRKDARDAIVAARGGVSGWAGATAYNRGQVLYRIAEVLEGRRAQFIAEIEEAEGASRAVAAAQVDEAIDRWVWYAGWADKFAQVAGNANPVAGPYFNISVPEPTGVVAIIAPQDSSLLGFVSAIAPALVAGNSVVVVASERFPLSAISLAEVFATSDVPKGVVNVLTGSPAEIAPWLASHADVNAIDLVGAGELDWISLEIDAADTLKRVLRPESGPDAAAPALGRISAFTETKTVWHTKSLR
jgi:aldehyde dehydrogenase (NAD+)